MKTALQTAIEKFKQDPIGFLRRAFYKTWGAPLKCRTTDGYDAALYWGDRFARYGTSLKGVGDEGLVLEIGCGNAFYTGLLKSCLLGEPKPFRDDSLFIVRKPPGQLPNAG